jgi:hypothetical protein
MAIVLAIGRILAVTASKLMSGRGRLKTPSTDLGPLWDQGVSPFSSNFLIPNWVGLDSFVVLGMPWDIAVPPAL